jgi:hypothetical protein
MRLPDILSPEGFSWTVIKQIRRLSQKRCECQSLIGLYQRTWPGIALMARYFFFSLVTKIEYDYIPAPEGIHETKLFSKYTGVDAAWRHCCGQPVCQP